MYKKKGEIFLVAAVEDFRKSTAAYEDGDESWAQINKALEYLANKFGFSFLEISE